MSMQNGKAGFAPIAVLLLGAVTAAQFLAQAPAEAQAQAPARAQAPAQTQEQTQAQDTDAVARGNAKFQHSCAPCHGPGPGNDGRALLPGTDALRLKYRGALPAVLEERSDLTAEILRNYVRQGSMSMPPFRPTELTDQEIEDIAAYLAVSSKRAARN